MNEIDYQRDLCSLKKIHFARDGPVFNEQVGSVVDSVPAWSFIEVMVCSS